MGNRKKNTKKKPKAKSDHFQEMKPASLQESLDSEHNALFMTNRGGDPVAIMMPAYIDNELKYLLLDTEDNLIKMWDSRNEAMIESYSIVNDMF